MKMLYYKNSWSCAHFSDMLAPTARYQLTGGKIVLGMPYESLTASVRAESNAIPLTVNTLSSHMLGMDLTQFVQGGGFAVRVYEGEFLWIPDCFLVAEFSMAEEEEISTSLTWTALTDYYCKPDAISKMLASQKTVLDVCCQPCQKITQQSFQVGHVVGPNFIQT